MHGDEGHLPRVRPRSVRHVVVRSWRMVVQKGDAAALVDEGTTIMLDQIQ